MLGFKILLGVAALMRIFGFWWILVVVGVWWFFVLVGWGVGLRGFRSFRFGGFDVGWFGSSCEVWVFWCWGFRCSGFFALA